MVATNGEERTQDRPKATDKKFRKIEDVTDLDGVTGGCIATVYQFADGSVAYFALDAPAWREADEIAGRALLAIKPLTTVFST